MADDVKSIVLRFTGESEEAQSDIETILGLLATLGGVEVDAKAGVATAGAEADISVLFAALKALDETHVEVDVDLNAENALKTARQEFTEITTRLAKLRKEMAAVQTDSPHFRARTPIKDAIQQDINAAEAELASLSSKIDAILARTANKKVDIEVDVHDEQLSLFAARLDEIDHKKATADVDLSTLGFEAHVAQVLAELQLLDASDVNIDVNIDTQKLSMGARLLNAFGIASQVNGSALDEFQSGISKLNINLPGFLGRLNATSGAAFALALAIGVTLVGALGALVASLAAAAAGLAVLATGFAAALGPALLLVIGVVQRLTAVWKVLKQEDQAQLQSEQERIQGNKAIVAALEQRRQAYLNLKRASADLVAAESQAWREMQDAIENATDAVLAFHRAQLEEESAKLGIKEAEFELKKFIHDMKVGQKEATALFEKFTDVAFDPSKLNKQLAKVKAPGVTGLDREEQELKLERLILNVKEARQSEKEATDGVSDSIRNKTRAEQDAQKFVNLGIKASDRYAAALRAEADARRAVKQAQQGVNDAKSTAAQAKVVAMTKDLSKNERILLGVLREVRDAFKETFGPGIQSVIKGIAVALIIIAKRIRPLKNAFKNLGDAFAGAIVAITDQLTSPTMIKAFQGFTNAATSLVAPLSSIFGSLFTILVNIATAALPLLLPLVQSVADTFASWADSTGNIWVLQIIIAGLVEQFQAWWAVFKVFASVFLEFFKIAAPIGKQLADALAKAGQSMLDWMKSDSGRQQLQEFLQVAVPLAIKMAGFFAQIVLFLARLGEIAGPILGPLLDLLSTQLNLLTRIARILSSFSRLTGQVIQFFVDLFDKVVGLLADLVDKFIQAGIDFIGGLIKGMAKKAKDLLGFVGDLGKKVLDKLKHPWKIWSPSRVTEGYGKNLVEGLKKGFERSASGLSASVEAHLTTPILDPLNAGKRAAPAAARAASAAAGGRGGNGDTIFQGDLILPSPAGGGMSDPRAHAVQIFGELTRRGNRGKNRR